MNDELLLTSGTLLSITAGGGWSGVRCGHCHCHLNLSLCDVNEFSPNQHFIEIFWFVCVDHSTFFKQVPPQVRRISFSLNCYEWIAQTKFGPLRQNWEKAIVFLRHGSGNTLHQRLPWNSLDNQLAARFALSIFAPRSTRQRRASDDERQGNQRLAFSGIHASISTALLFLFRFDLYQTVVFVVNSLSMLVISKVYFQIIFVHLF